MKLLDKTFPALVVAGLALAGCPGDDTGGTGGSAGDSTGSTGATTNNPNTTNQADSTTNGDPTEGNTDSETDSSSTGEEPGPFVFDETPPEGYDRIDRSGFPALSTALAQVGTDIDVYNAADPVDDAGLMFETEILTLLQVLHMGLPGMEAPDNTGLADDILGLGLIPCTPPPMQGDTCDNQVGPVAVPDTLRLELDGANAFPIDGRAPADPVMNIILAAMLLELSVEEITTFNDLDLDGVPGPGLNPIENDVPLPGAWPYLAPPHAME
ncbi:MAG: DUF4331 domain-containing protein [Deltaproteobacteria bacterium]|nr:DUF4331 domain-containing protein [Deltaproteobacteria bacterium]